MYLNALYRNDIQGLRALSVLAAIIYHYNSKMLPEDLLALLLLPLDKFKLFLPLVILVF